MARYGGGDYVRIQILAPSPSHKAMFVWMQVERCDDLHGIVYGTVDDHSFDEFSKALSFGSRLAASDRQVREREVVRSSTNGL